MKIFTIKLSDRIIAVISMLVPLMVTGFLVLSGQGKMQMLSEKELVTAWRTMAAPSSEPLYYLNYLPQSAIYYSDGIAAKLTGAEKFQSGSGFWVAIHKSEGDTSSWNCELRLEPKRGIFNLYLCTGTRDQ